MIGKIKNFNFESLFILNTFALIVTSYFFNNFIFTGVYILFFFISIFTTKNGLKIIKKFNLLQNIKNEGPANHFKKSDTPTMGGIFMIIPFLILLLIITINLGSLKLLLLLLTIFGFFITGFLDDFLSIKNKREIFLTKCHLNNFYIVSL
jgi:phospho-N-acetylmuramoyl-pentapeptide-transferase